VAAGGGDAESLVAGEDPCWAPNSRTVVFTRRVNHNKVLSLLDAPTKHVKDVGQISGSCSQPAWAR
jgi:Tol biopolymer transport system component